MPFANLFARLARAASRDEMRGDTNPKERSGLPSGTGQGQVRYRAIDELLEEHKDVIARIKLCYGCDNAAFHADLLEPIRGYAAYVNALPATRAGHHSAPCGLLRLGLDVAFYALQATDSQIFAGRQTISNRRLLEPRWRRATFIAGLCSELHRCLGQTVVRDAQGQTWQPYLLPLTAWLKRRHADRFCVQWRGGPEQRALGLFALPMIVPAATLEDLAQNNDVIVPHMLASVSGMASYHEHNVMDQLVRHAAALVINRERLANGQDGAEQDPPIYLARHVVEAMRALVLTDPNWLPNAPRSRLWYGQDGLYLVWPNGAADILRMLADERLPGAPGTAQAALEILVGGGVVPETFQGGYLVRIEPPGACEPISAVPIVSPGLLLAELEPAPAPLPRWLEVQAERMPPSPPPRRPGPDGAPSEAPDTTDPSKRAAPEPDVAKDKHLQTSAVNEGTSGMARSPKASPNEGLCEDPAPRGQRAPRREEVRKQPPGQAVLHAPLRLNRAVARALEAIVGSLHGKDPQCWAVGGTLFVPMSSLAKHGVDARQACRSLGDAGMLEPDGDGELVRSENIGGARVAGLRIGAKFVSGLQHALGADKLHREHGDVDAQL